MQVAHTDSEDTQAGMDDSDSETDEEDIADINDKDEDLDDDEAYSQEMESDETPGRIQLQLTNDQYSAARLLLLALKNKEGGLSVLVQKLVLALICDDGVHGFNHSPIEIYTIARSINREGRRKKLTAIMPKLCFCQYFILHGILKAILDSEGPGGNVDFEA